MGKLKESIIVADEHNDFVIDPTIDRVNRSTGSNPVPSAF